MWQPFFLAGTTLGAEATSASKSARGLGPADQTQGSLAQRDRGCPCSGGRSEPGRVGLQALLLGPPGGPKDLPLQSPVWSAQPWALSPPRRLETCLLLQQKGFHLPWNQHGLKTKPLWSAPSYEDACPSGPAPRGAPVRGEPGQVALPTSCVNCVSRRTPLVGFRADDPQSRQSQGRRFGARLLTLNDTREQSQLLWKVPRLPPQVGGLQGNTGGQTPSSRQPPGAHLRLESKAPGELFPGRSSPHSAISAREQVLRI